MPREAIKVVADVLAHELGLSAGQIMLEYQRFTIPETNGLYVALAYIGGKPIANNNYFTPVLGGITETQQTTMLYQVQIDLMSFDGSARTRQVEVYQALRSIFAQGAMEQNNLQIARMPSAFVNATSLEETKMLNRFTMTVAVTALLTKEQPGGEYYDDFTFQYDQDGNQSPILNPEETYG